MKTFFHRSLVLAPALLASPDRIDDDRQCGNEHPPIGQSSPRSFVFAPTQGLANTARVASDKLMFQTETGPGSTRAPGSHSRGCSPPSRSR
ncbi:hypothetical protein LZ32DRAFT_611264 [Colletotrichum eremochloae]|nr:hypothetical protein LZ32DRAFT_611264 [Colletotrichum eremochloae]